MEWLTQTLNDRRRAGVLVALALLATRLQTLFIPVYNGDEANYAGHALVMLGGGVPYVDFVEKKPPLIYLFYWVSFRLFGVSLPVVHALTILLVGATAWLVAKQIRLSLPQLHASAGALLYVLFSASFTERDVLATNCEIVMNLPAVAASWALLRAEAGDQRRRWLLWSGVFVGLAFLVKHQAGVGLAVTMLYLLMARRGWLRWIADEAVVLLGFVLPSLLVVAVYARLGRLPELYEWNVATNFSYVVGARMPLMPLIENAVVTTLTFMGAGAMPCVLAVAVLILPSLRRRAGALGRYHGLWLAAGLVPVAMGGRFYGHYYVQLYPPLCALAGITAGELLERRASLPRAARALFVAALVVPALFYQLFDIARYRLEEFEGAWSLHQNVADAVDAQSAPDDEIFVWGNYAHPYYFARRRPATRYIVCEYVLPFWEVYLTHRDHFSDADLKPWHRANFALLMKDLEQHRPKLILDTSRSPRFKSWAPFPLSAFPALDEFVRAHYDAVTSVEGVTILRRRSP